MNEVTWNEIPIPVRPQLPRAIKQYKVTAICVSNCEVCVMSMSIVEACTGLASRAERHHTQRASNGNQAVNLRGICASVNPRRRNPRFYGWNPRFHGQF